MGIIDKRGTDIDSRFRSLLQKAVRRGNDELVYTTSALLESLTRKEKSWLRNRTAVITFEECWPLGAELVFNRKYHSKVAALVKVSRSAKAKGATGLGYLGYALAQGDQSVLDGGEDDRCIKIIASATQRPDDFWNWLNQTDAADDRRILVENAARFKNIGRPRDRAVIQAAAYLAVFHDIPLIPSQESSAQPFPYWVALDMHTPQGRRTLKDVSRDLHIPLKQLEWTMFYFEGTVTNASVASHWWEKSCHWYFRKIGIPIDEARLLWEPAKPQVKEALNEESRQLHRELYTWKLANLERIDALKKQVELYISHFESGHPDQGKLF